MNIKRWLLHPYSWQLAPIILSWKSLWRWHNGTIPSCKYVLLILRSYSSSPSPRPPTPATLKRNFFRLFQPYRISLHIWVSSNFNPDLLWRYIRCESPHSVRHDHAAMIPRRWRIRCAEIAVTIVFQLLKLPCKDLGTRTKISLLGPSWMANFDPHSMFSPLPLREIPGKPILFAYATRHNKSHLECWEGYERRWTPKKPLAPTLL